MPFPSAATPSPPPSAAPSSASCPTCCTGRRRLARPHVHRHGGELRHLGPRPEGRAPRSPSSCRRGQARHRALPRRPLSASLSAAQSRRLPRAAPRRPPAGRRAPLREGLPRGGHPDLARRRRLRSNTHELLDFIDVAVVAERFCEQLKLSPARCSTICKSRGCRIGGVTLGERGLIWYDEARARPADCRRWTCRRTRIIDTNGAGDIFHGAYVYSYLTNPARAGRSTSASPAPPPPTRSSISATRRACRPSPTSRRRRAASRRSVSGGPPTSPPPRPDSGCAYASIRFATSSSITSVAPPPIAWTRASRAMRSMALPRM